MPAIWTSSRIRSGSSVSTRSTVSGPEDAELTAKPAGSRTASSSRTFAGTSSTTRIRGWGWFSAVISLAQATAHLVGELAHAYRLRQVAVEALGEEPLLVAAHRGRGEGDDRELGGAGVVPQLLERLVAAPVRHPDVHQHEGRAWPLRDGAAPVAAGCLQAARPEIAHCRRR